MFQNAFLTTKIQMDWWMAKWMDGWMDGWMTSGSPPLSTTEAVPYNYHKSNEFLNPTEHRKAKIAYNFGISECNRVK